MDGKLFNNFRFADEIVSITDETHKFQEMFDKRNFMTNLVIERIIKLKNFIKEKVKQY